jgi:hypothetical protein
MHAERECRLNLDDPGRVAYHRDLLTAPVAVDKTTVGASVSCAMLVYVRSRSRGDCQPC